MYSVISVKLDSLPANTGARQAAALHRSLTRVSTDYSQPAVPWISTLFPLFPRSDVSSFWDRTLNGNRVRSLHKRENVKSDLRKKWSPISEKETKSSHLRFLVGDIRSRRKWKWGEKLTQSVDTVVRLCGARLRAPPLAARPGIDPFVANQSAIFPFVGGMWEQRAEISLKFLKLESWLGDRFWGKNILREFLSWESGELAEISQIGKMTSENDFEHFPW